MVTDHPISTANSTKSRLDTEDIMLTTGITQAAIGECRTAGDYQRRWMFAAYVRTDARLEHEKYRLSSFIQEDDLRVNWSE